MTAKIIDGVAVAASIRSEIRERVTALARQGLIPGPAVIKVGADPASAVYVRNKMRACAEAGIRSFPYDFPADADPQAVLDLILELNARSDVHGILVQLPLPPQFSISRVLQTISAEKDVDGFHLYNVGGLVVGDTVFPPCTPYGVVKLLEHENIPIEGRNVVVVGASNIVGKPMALMLMQRDATVCISPRQDARSGAVHDPRRHPRRRRRRSQLDPAADGQDRSGRHRCRHQSPSVRASGWRRRL